MSDAATTEQEDPAGAPDPGAGQQQAPELPARQPSASEIAGVGAADAGTPDGQEPPPGDDWRDRLAGKDEKMLARLRRFASLENFGKSYREMENKLHSGMAPRSLPEGASEEEVAAYRKDLGVPEAPDGYGIELPDGQASDTDKAILAAVLDAAHKSSVPPPHLKPIVETYLKQREEAQKAFAEQGAREAAETRRVLRGEWGREWDLNMRVVDTTLDQYTGGRGAELANIMMANGQPLATHELFARFAANVGRDVAPAAVLEFGGSGGGGKTIQEQIDEGLSVMGNDPNKYWSEAHQKRMSALYEAQEKLAARGQAA